MTAIDAPNFDVGRVQDTDEPRPHVTHPRRRDHLLNQQVKPDPRASGCVAAYDPPRDAVLVQDALDARGIGFHAALDKVHHLSPPRSR
jgi:hypothetical protein